MKNRLSTRTIAFGSLLISSLSLSLISLGSAFGTADEIRGCVNKKTLVLRVSSKCTKDETKIKWNVTGPQGLQGEPGLKGDAGPIGPQGEKGERGESGAKGETGAQGAKGDTGAQGLPGVAGPTSTLSVFDRNGSNLGLFTSYNSYSQRIVVKTSNELWEIDLGSGQIATAFPIYTTNDCSGNSYTVGAVADAVFVDGRGGGLVKVLRSAPITIASPYIWYRGSCQTTDAESGAQFFQTSVYSGARPVFSPPLRIANS